MHPDPCVICRRGTGVAFKGLPCCSQCQQDARYHSGIQRKLLRLANGGWYRHDDDPLDCDDDEIDRKYCEWGNNRDKKYEPAPEVDPKVVARRKAEEKARIEAAKLMQAKQDRMHAADVRLCPECEMIGKCDPNDYLCIVCREGTRDCIPPGYAHYWTRPVAEAAEAA